MSVRELLAFAAFAFFCVQCRMCIELEHIGNGDRAPAATPRDPSCERRRCPALPGFVVRPAWVDGTPLAVECLCIIEAARP